MSTSIVGAWRLHSCKNIFTETSKVAYPFGEEAKGYVMYQPDGYFALSLTSKDRTLCASDSPFDVSEAEKLNIADEFFAYFGRYEFQNDKVIHKIEQCTFPNWIGKELLRYAALNGKILILTTDPFLYEGKKAIAEVIWKRVE